MRSSSLLLAASVAWAVLSPAAHAADVLTKNQNLGSLAVPNTLNYGQSFNGLPLGMSAADTFHDDYSFDVLSASFSSATITINLSSFLSLSELSVSLYRYLDLNQLVYGADLATSPSLAQLVASGSGAPNSTQTSINNVDLSAGRYVLDISGQITGSAGGSYAGVLNLAPVLQAVPEPAGLVLASVGLLSLLGFRRKRG